MFRTELGKLENQYIGMRCHLGCDWYSEKVYLVD
jgi:hypothetical protein